MKIEELREMVKTAIIDEMGRGRMVRGPGGSYGPPESKFDMPPKKDKLDALGEVLERLFAKVSQLDQKLDDMMGGDDEE